MKELLALDGVEAGYTEKPILSGVRLTLDEGELVVLCGGSGGGKSTLLRVAAGLHPARSTRRRDAHSRTSCSPCPSVRRSCSSRTTSTRRSTWGIASW